MLGRALAAVFLAGLALAPGAAASFPGKNGSFAVGLDGCSENRYIRAYSPAGRALAPLTPRCAPGDEEDIYASTFDADWSPDGTRLVYVQADAVPAGIVTAATDGSDQQLVPMPAELAGRGAEPSFAPDGQRIAFTADRAIWTVRTDGSELRRVRASPACTGDTDNCVHVEAPRWSPDGRTIAFESVQWAFGPGKPSPLKPGIWLMNAQTGRLIRRLSRGGHEADWSPDGRRLVFRTEYEQASETRGGTSGGNLFVVRADGKGKASRLVHKRGTAETTPAWSPDGRSIFWISLRHGGGDVAFDLKSSLWRVRARGGRPRRVANLPGPGVEEGFFSAPTLSWQPRR